MIRRAWRWLRGAGLWLLERVDALEDALADVLDQAIDELLYGKRG